MKNKRKTAAVSVSTWVCMLGGWGGRELGYEEINEKDRLCRMTRNFPRHRMDRTCFPLQ